MLPLETTSEDTKGQCIKISQRFALNSVLLQMFPSFDGLACWGEARGATSQSSSWCWAPSAERSPSWAAAAQGAGRGAAGSVGPATLGKSLLPWEVPAWPFFPRCSPPRVPGGGRCTCSQCPGIQCSVLTRGAESGCEDWKTPSANLSCVANTGAGPLLQFMQSACSEIHLTLAMRLRTEPAVPPGLATGLALLVRLKASGCAR